MDLIPEALKQPEKVSKLQSGKYNIVRAQEKAFYLFKHEEA
ncbi:uncharacterized protein G2W53_029050 [Senna tora]|uniref:Uncharacterized protein n=1 Tax=Senna tora TaxID=362788 RepID=A0A834T4R8_9FABA|nr:uncharacterized protein G2W53_029050 [Senna tora]